MKRIPSSLTNSTSLNSKMEQIQSSGQPTVRHDLGYCVYGADFGDGVGALGLFAWRVLGALKQSI